MGVFTRTPAPASSSWKPISVTSNLARLPGASLIQAFPSHLCAVPSVVPWLRNAFAPLLSACQTLSSSYAQGNPEACSSCSQCPGPVLGKTLTLTSCNETLSLWRLSQALRTRL